jgi:hypothetical protein
MIDDSIVLEGNGEMEMMDNRTIGVLSLLFLVYEPIEFTMIQVSLHG